MHICDNNKILTKQLYKALNCILDGHVVYNK